jgi:hypothetical protein
MARMIESASNSSLYGVFLSGSVRSEDSVWQSVELPYSYILVVENGVLGCLGI